MAKRYYCPQYRSFAGEWIDLPEEASLSKKKAKDYAAAYPILALKFVLTRVIKKPYGWEPKEKS